MKKIVKPFYDNGKNKPVRTTSSEITRRRPRSIRKGEPSWKIYYDTEEEYQNAMHAEEQLRQKQTQQYLQKKDREAANADRLFGSLRSANNAAAEQINKPVISKRQIKQAQKEQEEKNINTWKPALNTVDLGVNLVSLLRPNPYMYAGSMLWDAFQMGDDIATGDVPINSTASLLFDGIGYAGATNRLKPITIRIPRSRSTSGLPRSHRMTINTDKVADVTGTGFNVLDGSNDVYGIGKFGLNYANTPNPNLMFKPFSYDDGKDKNKSVIYYDSSTGEYSSDLSPKLTVLNRIGDDPTQWTYTDDKGRLYTPIQTQVNSGEITQGKDPSVMDRFLNWSEQHYNNPILGVPARYAYMIKNNQDPITGVASFMPGVGEVIDLASATADALSGNYGSAIVGGAASLLPFVPYNKVRKLYNRLSKSFGHNTTQDVSNAIGDMTNQTKYTPSDEDIYQAYLDSDDFKYDARTYNNLADNGFFGPDYYGYINDYNRIYDENKQIHNAIQSAMNNPNITEDQVTDLIDQRSTASYPFYPPYPFAESSEILNSYERAQNAKRDLNNNYPIRNLFQFRDNVHDNHVIQQMRDLVQHYRNAEQSGEPLQQMLMPSLFVRNTNNPEFISLRDELYRYQDLARSQEHERLRQQFEQIPKPTNSTQVEENSLTDKQIANSLMRNESYDPNNLPEEFIDATGDVSDITGTAYFYDDPKKALQRARNDFKLLQHGQAWNLNHHGAVSTDSYPLMLAMFRRHQKDGLIKPIKDKDGNIKFMRLNSFGKHKGEDAVKRINKTINDLSETIGEQLPEAQVDNGNIYVPQVLFRKYDRGKNKSVIQNTIAYNQWRSTLPKNLQTETPDYDLYGAFKAGLQPEWNDEDKSYHLGSRDPKTGKILKKPSHPTFGQAIYNDMLLGYYPIYKDGDIYTVNPFEYNSGKDSGIHIKKANRGKFTAAAKRAGMGVQAYARKILSAPKGKYSPTLRRRAAFAKAASKFKH